MTCLSTGDPHMKTFAGHHCDLMGLGVYTMVELENMRVNTFHCPSTSGWAGASTNVGVALRVGVETVVIIGNTVSVNGQSVDESTNVGGAAISINGGTVDVNVGGLQLVSIKRTRVASRQGTITTCASLHQYSQRMALAPAFVQCEKARAQ